MKTITVTADMNQLETVTQFIEAELDAAACPLKAQLQVVVAVEEIFVNIVHYAYHPTEGEATIRCEVSGTPLQITIEILDGGRPFNPLDRPDADITLSAEDRDIGGLGIFMVKKSMDQVDYRYERGVNILTIKKQI